MINTKIWQICISLVSEYTYSFPYCKVNSILTGNNSARSAHLGVAKQTVYCFFHALRTFPGKIMTFQDIEFLKMSGVFIYRVLKILNSELNKSTKLHTEGNIITFVKSI